MDMDKDDSTDLDKIMKMRFVNAIGNCIDSIELACASQEEKCLSDIRIYQHQTPTV